jgi:hypothetical protein
MIILYIEKVMLSGNYRPDWQYKDVLRGDSNLNVHFRLSGESSYSLSGRIGFQMNCFGMPHQTLSLE